MSYIAIGSKFRYVRLFLNFFLLVSDPQKLKSALQNFVSVLGFGKSSFICISALQCFYVPDLSPD